MHTTSHSKGRRSWGLWIWIGAGLTILGLLSANPSAWARPGQAPDYQTVPTLTPTPRREEPTSTPTDTPEPAPTDTPEPEPTNTRRPSPTDEPNPPTDTPSPPTATATPLPARTATPVAVAPGQCWTFPTPGFSPPRLARVSFEAESDHSLVVPGQSVGLFIEVTNNGAAAITEVLICNPLAPGLRPGQPTSSQGQVRLEPEGLLAELGTLAPGATAQVSVTLEIPSVTPLGGVIESQGWLFSRGIEVATSLVTWALPPAWLPPTGE